MSAQFSIKNELMNEDLVQGTILAVFAYIILLTLHLTPCQTVIHIQRQRNLEQTLLIIPGLSN